MAGKTPNPTPEQHSTPPTPQPDPILMRQQQLQQQLQQVNQRIMDLRQQKTLAEDMITDASMTAAEIRGRLAEIALQQKAAEEQKEPIEPKE